LIKKRGKRFWLDVWISGKRIRRSLKTDEYSLALERARDLAESLRRGSRSRDIGLKEIVAQYYDWAKIQKPTSAREEKYRLDRMIEYFKNLDLNYLGDISPFHIEKMRSWLLENKKSRATVNRHCQLLRSLFYRAIDWEVFHGQNPVRKIKFFKERPEIHDLSAEDIKRIMAGAMAVASSAQSPAQKIIPDFIELAFMTGLRKSEILNLKWRNVRDEEIEIRGKGEKQRLVPINGRAKKIIFKQPRTGEFVFDIPNRHQPDLFRRTIKQIRKRSGVPFHLHLCRHTFATRLLAAGVDIVTIAEILGHGSSMTSLLYSHTSPDRKKQAVKLLEKD